ISGVIAAIDILNKQGEFKIKAEEIQKGIENVIKNTNFMGRWQCIQEKPMIVCDTGHNQHGLSLTIPKLQRIKHQKLHIILGVVNDKEVDNILDLFPKSGHYYFCKASIPRALDAGILKEKAEKYDLIGEKFSTVDDAIQSALKKAQKKDLIFIGGSTFVVADALMFFNNIND
ncbi:MAG: bifunctional folylpolyglutamate synthase/dihydrofolate synthase, partial [Bacteroidales bacterium]|nr:bifunctional folylpolyglutamate synthase/dihydrofolate synthase [Bacteroidales bacterium]